MNWVVISDEVSAAAWRLAGARPLIADAHSVKGRFAEARQADLVLITADLARLLPTAVLEAALLAEKPLIALIAGPPGSNSPPDIEQDVKRVLGVAI